MSSSMLYTIGMAINRAHEHGLEVSILVDGHWIEGVVVASDGMGVVLEGLEGEHAIVKSERMAAVKVRSSSPFHPSIDKGNGDTFNEAGFDSARPMPGPRAGDA